MLAAVVLQRPFRGRAIVRTLFLVPYALPMYAGVIAWNFMFQKDNGVINHILVNLGLLKDGAFWLIGDKAFIALVVVAIWRWWPFAFLMLMAGLQSIPADVYEAAALDGAKPLRQWWSITLPMLRPVNLVLLLNMFLWTFNDFNTPYVLFGTLQPSRGGPHLLPHLQRLVPDVELRHRIGDVRPAAHVPAARVGPVHRLHQPEDRRCVTRSDSRSSGPSSSSS